MAVDRDALAIVMHDVARLLDQGRPNAALGVVNRVLNAIGEVPLVTRPVLDVVGNEHRPDPPAPPPRTRYDAPPPEAA